MKSSTPHVGTPCQIAASHLYQCPDYGPKGFYCSSNCFMLLLCDDSLMRIHTRLKKRNCNAVLKDAAFFHFPEVAGILDALAAEEQLRGDITHGILLKYLWHPWLNLLGERAYTLPLALMRRSRPLLPWCPCVAWTATGWARWDHCGVLVPNTLLSWGLISEHNWKHLPKVEPILSTE